jgi:hypothetical protein
MYQEAFIAIINHYEMGSGTQPNTDCIQKIGVL